jgi:hypothetical protein
MNVRIMTHPAVIIAVAGVVTILAVGNQGKSSLWRRLADENPPWRAGLVPAAWGALAALIFNDSGIVAALFLLGAFLATGVFLLFVQPATRPASPELESGTLSA